SSRTGSSRWSISKATTFPEFRARCSVRAPIPGPISIAPDFSVRPENDTILWRMFGSIRKFWPRLFLNENPYLSRISLVLTGVAMSLCMDVSFFVNGLDRGEELLAADPEHGQALGKLLAVRLSDL